MAATKFLLSFTDGEEREVTRRLVDEMHAEVLLGVDSGPTAFLVACLWSADTGGKGTRKDMESWAEGLHDWKVLPKESAGSADAGPPDGSPGTSQS
jgi:hypothetical protein